MSAGGPPSTRKSCISYASPISIFSGMLVAVNRPPGRGMAIGTMLNGFDGFGLLGLIEATSKVASDDTAAGARGVLRRRCCRSEQDGESETTRRADHVRINLSASLHVCRMRLSDQGARTLAISGSSAGDSIQTASSRASRQAARRPRAAPSPMPPRMPPRSRRRRSRSEGSARAPRSRSRRGRRS